MTRYIQLASLLLLLLFSLGCYKTTFGSITCYPPTGEPIVVSTPSSIIMRPGMTDFYWNQRRFSTTLPCAVNVSYLPYNASLTEESGSASQLTESQVYAIIENRKNDFDYCFNSNLPPRMLSSDYEILFSIGRAGVVNNVASFSNDQIASCLIGTLGNIRFPPNSGTLTGLRHTFTQP